MKRLNLISLSIILITAFTLKADIIYVESQSDFDNAHDSAAANDSIIWRDGTYSDIFMDIENDNLFIAAENLGKTIFTGESRVDIDADYITLQGFQFLNGDIGTNDVINTRGSYGKFTHININGYTSYKYLRVREESQFVEITYCNFENRLNLDDQNILSILVDENIPGYHKIQYCSFKNFDGTGNDLGIEPIRIGLSTQANHVSRCLVEYCYFTQCNGDGELISSKASQNVYRFNTFEDNPKAELVLRHGSNGIVYGNFFLNGKGGVRIREGQNHYIYNNYFYEIDDRPIYIQNESSDPLDNINIAYNTITDCSEVILGGSGSYQPTNVTFANNIFSNPDDDLFEDETGTETWIGNMAFGSLGIPLPTNGLSEIDPILEQNDEGFFGLGENSPAINAAQSGYDFLPNFEGVENIDVEILFDIMAQERPALIEEKDIGCSEYPQTLTIQPIATEENTGPSYDTDIATSTQNIIPKNSTIIEINPNPVVDELNINFKNENPIRVSIEIYTIEGKSVGKRIEKLFAKGENLITENVNYLSAGLYTLHVSYEDVNNGSKNSKTIKFVK